MKPIALYTSMLLVFGAGSAWAQPTPLPPIPPSGDVVFFNVGAAPAIAFAGPIDIVGGAGAVPGAVVAGKPYSADSVTESAQVLADGNRIVQRNGARVYRDSQGRTRLEQTIGSVGAGSTASEAVTLISINDPVAEVAYTLHPQQQIARQFRPLKIALGDGAALTAAVPASPVPPPPGTPGQRVQIERGVIAGGGFGVGGPPPPGVAMTRMINGGSFTAVGAAAPRIEDLGDQVIEGVLAHGTRHTQTIEAGAIGNERPIEIVAEQWYSAEIEALVLRRNVDPRFGETTYRLVNVNRGEPAVDLFAVPQGYALEVMPEPSQRFNSRPFGGPGAPAPRN